MAQEADTGAYPFADGQQATMPIGGITVPTQPGPARFCASCGQGVSGARFCAHCGAPAGTTPSPNVSAQPHSPTPQLIPAPTDVTELHLDDRVREASASRRALIVVAGVVAVLIVVAAGLVLLLRGSADAYPAEVRAAVRPLIADNAVLATTMSSLKPGGSAADAQAAVTKATGNVHAAQATLSALQPKGGDDRAIAGRLRAAVDAESTWLAAAGAVLQDPHSAQASQLTALAEQAGAVLRVADADVPGLGAGFAPSTQLVTWAQAQVSAASAAQAERSFSGRVMDLLDQSGEAYTKINALFSQLSSAADGFGASITLAQAEQTISTVVANREGLAASARALDAPTPVTVKVRSALVAAISDSLADDQQINDCLNQNNYGSVAYIFQSCLDSTQSANSMATSAKEHFYTVYNQLRHKLGQPATRIAF